MKTRVMCVRFFLLALCVALFAALAPGYARGDEAAPQKDAEWKEIFADDKGYLDEYNKLTEKEETFSGTLTYEEQKGASTLMRWLPYKLDGVGVYTGSKDLKEFVGKKVEIIGKKHTFELEGQTLTEIWPVKIRLVPAQAEQPKAAPPKEIPAKAVDGLLFEIKLLNKQPLLPGDTLEVEYRFTNTQENGDIQICVLAFLGSEFFNADLIGPDGKPVFSAVNMKMKLALPEGPTSTLKPGCFYGGKQVVRVPEGLKPGKYSLTFNYKNLFDLKDKGFNCWTGDIESNTIVFEVAVDDSEPVNGIKMLVRMTKDRYIEGEPVMIEVRFYNAGDKEQEVYVPDDFLLSYYSDGAVTEGGRAPVEWKTIATKVAPDVKYEKLAPGAMVVKEYDLRGVCDMPRCMGRSVNGDKPPLTPYKFRLTSIIPTKDASVTYKSNTVHFLITKPGYKETPWGE